MSHVSQYGLLGFVQALELVFTQAIQFVLGLGLIVLGWVLCRKFGTPVPSAVSRQVRNSSINDDSPSRHDQSPLEGTVPWNDRHPDIVPSSVAIAYLRVAL